MKITTDVLLKGCWYAVEQCGRMLHHAAILHRAEAYSTAAAVALLGREELGAHKLLLKHWRSATKTGIEPDAENLSTALHNHTLKQELSQILIRYAHAGGGFERVARRVFELDPASQEYWDADKELNDLLRQMARGVPERRHILRLHALYVDIDPSGTRWVRPAEFSPAEATKCLLDAVNDYARVADNLRLEILEHRCPFLAAALRGWPDKPPLLAPDWDFKKFFP